MSVVFESRQRSFLQDESYPNIDQAGDDVDRYDEADDSNVAAVMHDVGDVSDLAAAVTVSYHPPVQSILAGSEPSRLDVDDVVVGGDSGDGADHDMTGPPAMSSAVAAAAAAAAAANIAAAEAEAAQAAARHSSSSGQPLQPASLSPTSPQSLKEASSPSVGLPVGPHRIKPIPKPERDVQKNGQGLFQCTWPDCTEETQQFGRKCEYNKHMDKHERPYRCTAEGCEKLPGFTYSGGLLRHEREVHGKHGGPRNPLHCPHPTCKRHSGKGFSRQENLNEHLRRVHTTISPTNSTPLPILGGNNIANTLLGQANSGLLNLDLMRSLASVLPSSPSPAGDNGNNGNNAATGAAAAAAVTLQSSVLSADESDDAKAMESLGLLLPRGRKRRASSLMDEDDDDAIVTSQHLGDYHGHHGLREEVKRVRQENEELRRQVELQKRQTMEMMQQITQLQRAAGTQQQQHNQHDQHPHQHHQRALGSSLADAALGSTASPSTTIISEAAELLAR